MKTPQLLINVRLVCLSAVLLVAVGLKAEAGTIDGVATGQFALHDFLISSGTPDNHGHASHWTWVEPTPPGSLTTVTYFIHNHGDLTGAQIDRINDGAAVWNTSGANVLLSEVNLDTLGEIHVHGTNISSLGLASFTYFTAHNRDQTGGTGTGYTDGHFQHHMKGNVEPGDVFSNTRQVLTMDIRDDWYTGASAGGITVGEYDYLTVAIQEFGHLLGLAHPNETGGHPSGESNISPMNGSLPANTTRRVLQLSDVVAIKHLYGATAIPEPSSFILLGAGVLGLLGYSWRRKQHAV